jgi:hypothetical protein
MTFEAGAYPPKTRSKHETHDCYTPGVVIDNKDPRYAGLFMKPSDGLEPSTPSFLNREVVIHVLSRAL